MAHLDCLFAILRDFPLIDVAIVETSRQNCRSNQSHTVYRRLNVLLQNARQVILSVQEPSLNKAVFRSREQDVLIVNFYVLETSDNTLVCILGVETAGLSPDFECKLVLLLIGNPEEKCVWQLVERFDASCHFDPAFREGLASHDTAVGEVDHRGVCLRYDEQFGALL